MTENESENKVEMKSLGINPDSLSTRDILAEERTYLANERTDWAEHRTLLANERTFSAWIRTGLAAMGGGLAIAELLKGDDGILPKAIGIILVIMGAAICVMALWRYNNITDVLGKKGLPVISKMVAFILVGGLLLVTSLVLVLILIG